MIHPKFPHRILYVLFISLIAFGLSMGKSLMSIGVIAISANWILEGKFKEKWELLRKRKYLPAIFLIFFLTHILWGLFSDNFAEILDDLRRKLPLLALPITIGTSKKLEKTELMAILGSFLLGLVISSGIGFSKYLSGDYENYRDLSRFVSHIRFGLFLAFGVGVATYLFSITKHNVRFLYLLAALFLISFIRVLGSGTGYVAGGLAIILSLIYVAKTTKKTWIYYSSIATLIFGVIAIGLVSYNQFKSITTPREGVYDNPPVYTAQMNLYVHHPEIKILENGYPVFMNYCPSELRDSWNERSKIPIDSLDRKGQLIHGTVMRYMTSLGLMKDAEGVAKLSDKDVKNIENGIASTVPSNSGFNTRLQETLLEYLMFRSNMNPNGHSLVQRLYYLEAGWNLTTNNLLTGVTIGDEEKAYQQYYNEVESPLSEEHRLRAHNQLLSFLVCFGIIGTTLLMFAILFPILKTPVNFLSILFLAVTVAGFLSDDMLNRQAGVTFVALFYCLIYLSGTNLKRNNFVSDTVN